MDDENGSRYLNDQINDASWESLSMMMSDKKDIFFKYEEAHNGL